jgi:hypothetical protein
MNRWYIQPYPIYFPREELEINWNTWKDQLVLQGRTFTPRELREVLINLGIAYTNLNEGYLKLRETMPQAEWMKEQVSYLRSLNIYDLELVSLYGSKPGSQFINGFSSKNIFILNSKRFTDRREYQQRLNQIIEAAPRPTKPFNVYRGQSSNKTHAFCKTHNKIISTSANLLMGLIYTHFIGVLNIIKCMPETPCLFISVLAFDGDAEFEIIFPSSNRSSWINSYSHSYLFEGQSYFLKTNNYVYY